MLKKTPHFAGSILTTMRTREGKRRTWYHQAMLIEWKVYRKVGPLPVLFYKPKYLCWAWSSACMALALFGAHFSCYCFAPTKWSEFTLKAQAAETEAKKVFLGRWAAEVWHVGQQDCQLLSSLQGTLKFVDGNDILFPWTLSMESRFGCNFSAHLSFRRKLLLVGNDLSIIRRTYACSKDWGPLLVPQSHPCLPVVSSCERFW